MTPHRATAMVLLGLALMTAASTGAAASTTNPTVPPCPNGHPVGSHTVCRGPVVHHSGGGGGTLTIALSAVVGLGVAAAAVVVVRRRIALDATRPPRARGPKGPS